MLMMEELLGYVLIGAVGLILLAVLYLPVYFILRNRISMPRQLAYFLFIGCVLVIAGATVLETVIIRIADGMPLLSAMHSLNLIPFQFITTEWGMSTRKQITQEIANVMMFVPLGFIFPAVYKRLRRCRWTILCTMGVSFCIEFMQYFIGRSADVDDVLLNTCGGVIGYLLFIAFSRFFKDRKNWKRFIGTE